MNISIFSRSGRQTLLVVTALAGTTLAVSVFAQAPAGGSPADQMFRTLDADGNGEITVREGAPATRTIRQQLFGLAGKGINDALTRGEFDEVYEKFRAAATGGRPQSGAAPVASASGTGRRVPASASARGTRPGPTQALDPNVPQTWRGWVVMNQGNSPNDQMTEIELTITGTQMRGRDLGRNGGQGGGRGPLGGGTFVMDAAAGTLDVTQTEGGNAGKHYPGIFQLEGDVLRWCVSNVDRRRPTQLAGMGTSAYLMVLRRQGAAPQQ
jgi:uncharacterized protein (TIGR03067 family)